MAERWARGGGSGIGTSGHVNSYREGVLVGNFVEDAAGREYQATGRHSLGFGEPFRGQSTQRVSYNEYGKTGAELAYVSQRQDKEQHTKGISGDLLMRHGDFWAPRQTYFASMNQLTFPANRFHGESRTDAYVWSGSNRHNATVPLSTRSLGLTATKSRQWQGEGSQSPYTTTTRSALHAAALPAAENPTRTQTFRTTGGLPGGEPLTIGRKPLGVHRDECDKVYRRTGLRDRWYSGNLC